MIGEYQVRRGESRNGKSDVVAPHNQFQPMVTSMVARAGMLGKEARRPVFGRHTLAAMRDQARALISEIEAIEQEIVSMHEAMS